MLDADVKPKTLKEAINYLGEAVANAIISVSTIDPNDLNTLIKAFKLLDDQITSLEGHLKDLKTVFNRLDKEILPNKFIELEIDSMKIKGYNFILAHKLYASITEENREKGFKWLRDKGYGEAIKETIHAGTLSSLVSNYIETNAIEPPEDTIKIHRQNSISIRKTS